MADARIKHGFGCEREGSGVIRRGLAATFGATSSLSLDAQQGGGRSFSQNNVGCYPREAK